MSAIDNAISRLQDLALACTGIKGAPDYPVSDAGVLPLAIAHLTEGTFSPDDATANRGLYTIAVDFHFNRMSLKDAYTRINTLVPEYKDRLSGDPKLNGTVDTIVFPVSFAVSPAQWDEVTTQMCSFRIPVKVREANVST